MYCTSSRIVLVLHRIRWTQGPLQLSRSLRSQPVNTNNASVNRHPRSVPLINTATLRETLEAVREANRASLIRKVAEDGISTPLQLSSPVAQPKQPLGLSGHTDVHEPVTGTSAEYNKSNIKQQQRRENKVRIKELLPGDYAGEVYPVQSQWRAHTTSASTRWRYPWLYHLPPGKTGAAYDSHARLTAEINAFTDYLTPTPAEVDAASRAFDDIRLVIASILPDHSLELLGSRANGLATPLSDLDINLKPKLASSRLDDVQDRDRILDLVRALSKQMRKESYRNSIVGARALRITSFISRARVPIIKGIHLPTGLDFQISHTTSGYNSTEYARAFLQEFPSLKGLYLVVKQMLTMRGLCEGPHGGLTSYPLLNMIVASLKLKTRAMGKMDLASHLLGFLDMYSEIDFYTTGLSVSPPAYIQLSDAQALRNSPSDTEAYDAMVDGREVGEIMSFRRSKSSHQMYLVDPADPSNNLGLASHMIKHIQATIIHARGTLRQSLQTWEQGSTVEGSTTHDGGSVLACLTEGDYKPYQLERVALRDSYTPKVVRKIVQSPIA